jgi:nucleoside-diphosphate-sugar epimerase
MILITGSNGFVGSALCAAARARGLAVRAAVRQQAQEGQVAVGDLGPDTDWGAALEGCTAVIHAAARVHVMADDCADPLAAYRAVNRDASLALARQAHAAGVRRFVFVSSIKVNGEASGARPFRPDDAADPHDPYGQSKHEAETALLDYGRASGLEVVIVRPPLVYGPGVKANFMSLMGLVRKGIPLPIGKASGLRSMVALDNLVDLLLLCVHHPAAAGRVFLVSDGTDLTVPALVDMMAHAMGKRSPVFPVPVRLVYALARLARKQAVADRLFGSLQVDIAQTRSALEWRPVISTQAAIAHTVAAYLHSR